MFKPVSLIRRHIIVVIAGLLEALIGQIDLEQIEKRVRESDNPYDDMLYDAVVLALRRARGEVADAADEAASPPNGEERPEGDRGFLGGIGRRLTGEDD